MTYTYYLSNNQKLQIFSWCGSCFMDNVTLVLIQEQKYQNKIWLFQCASTDVEITLIKNILSLNKTQYLMYIQWDHNDINGVTWKTLIQVTTTYIYCTN